MIVPIRWKARPASRRHGGPPASPWLSWQVAFDAWRFKRHRRRYYDYLSALLTGTRGARTLKQIFEADACRYGLQSSRGRLSHRWLQLFQAAGGDLYATWFGVFPAAELAVIRSAQLRGNAALMATLGEMSRVLGVLDAAVSILRASLSAAVVAAAVVTLTLLALPAFTVPRLRETFSIIPSEFHGAPTRSLFELAEIVSQGWPLMLGCLVLAPWLLTYSFSRYAGRLRSTVDKIGPWRVYRQVQALRFLALLAVALGPDEHGSTRLRMALSLQLTGATPWMHGHVEAMLTHADAGRAGTAIFDTGLLDSSQLWFLDDMISARGLVEGLRQCSAWVERHVLTTVARQAALMRWCMLVGAVASVLGIALWHYAAIDDMRRALALLHASQ